MTDTPNICFLSESRCNYKTSTKVTLNGINLGNSDKNDSIKLFLNNDQITDIIESTSSFIIFNVPTCNKICTKKLMVSVNDIMSNTMDFSYCPEITSISKDSIVKDEFCEIHINLNFAISFNKPEVYFGDKKCDNITNINDHIITVIPPVNFVGEINTVNISVIISGVECINKIPFTYIYKNFYKDLDEKNKCNNKIVNNKVIDNKVTNEDELSDANEDNENENKQLSSSDNDDRDNENKIVSSSDNENNNDNDNENENDDNENKKSSSSDEDDEEHITKELLLYFKIKMKYQKIKQEYKKAKQTYEMYMHSSRGGKTYKYATTNDGKPKYATAPVEQQQPQPSSVEQQQPQPSLTEQQPQPAYAVGKSIKNPNIVEQKYAEQKYAEQKYALGKTNKPTNYALGKTNKPSNYALGKTNKPSNYAVEKTSETPKYETPKYAQSASIYADPATFKKNVSMDIKKNVVYAPSSSKMNLKSIIGHTLHTN